MKALKNFVTKILSKKSGKRFLYAYHKANKYISSHILVKIGLTILAIISLLIGIILLFIPGPGFVFIIISLALLAIVSRRLAVYLDKIEQEILKLRK